MSEFEVLAICYVIGFICYLYSLKPDYIEQECTCGKYNKCISKIKITSSGSISRKPSEFLKCGKVEKQLEQIKKLRSTQDETRNG